MRGNAARLRGGWTISMEYAVGRKSSNCSTRLSSPRLSFHLSVGKRRRDRPEALVSGTDTVRSARLCLRRRARMPRTRSRWWSSSVQPSLVDVRDSFALVPTSACNRHGSPRLSSDHGAVYRGHLDGVSVFGSGVITCRAAAVAPVPMTTRVRRCVAEHIAQDHPTQYTVGQQGTSRGTDR